MRKLLLVFLTANALCFSGSPIFAADNPFGKTAPASVSIYDWYNVGEFFNSMGWLRFNYSVYNDGSMDDTYKQFSELLKKAQVSDATLSAFNDWYAIVKALPWDNRDYSKWPKKDQDAWNSPVWGRLWDSLKADFRKNIESLFAYWLGYHTLDLVWNVPYLQKDPQGVQSRISSAASDFLEFSTNADYKTVFSALKPEVQNAIIFIASMKKKIPDPDNPLKKAGQGLTPDDVAKVVESAKVIREAAQASQLTSA
jgi:hypothetical protein